MIKNKILFSLILILFFTGIKANAIKDKNKEEASEWATKMLSELSLEKKVAQLVCMDISGAYMPEDDPKYQSWLELAGKYGIGGFVFYGGTPLDITCLLNRLQKEAEIPLLISADFEGGPGQQVKGASEFPGNMGFAATCDEGLMYRAAKIMGEEGRAMGIHLTYTPVTDVSLYPDNPQESVRSFGGDINLMAKMLKAYVKGYNEAGMLTTSKHFPGRGDMKAMPGYPQFNYLDKSAEELENNEFRAFKNAVDAGVSFIMTEHIAVPSVTGGSVLPASVEPKLVKGIIRDKLGFEGIITTDDLCYNHVMARFGNEDVAVKALEAGHDILLKPKDPVATIKAVVAAVEQGGLDEKQIDQSVYKLLYQKALLGLHNNRFTDMEQVKAVVGTCEHQELVQEVADKSVTMLKDDGVFPLEISKQAKITHILVQKFTEQPNASELIGQINVLSNQVETFRLIPNLHQGYYNKVKESAGKSDLIILSFFTQRERHGEAAPIRDRDLQLINEVIKTKPESVIAMSYGNPHIIRKIRDVPAFLTGYGEGGWYGNQTVYFESFVKILKGELIPTGKLPLDVGNGYPIGFGLTF